MSIARIAGLGVGYSRAMDTIAAKMLDPTVVEDPGRLLEMNKQAMYAKTGYELAVRGMQDLHQADQMLNELLRDA